MIKLKTPLDNPQKNNLSDKLWRLQNLYKIKDKNRKVVNLKFNTVQIKIIDSIKGMKPIRHYDLKSRQQGVSTFWLLWWLDDTIFTRGTNTGILAHVWESLMYLMEIVSLAHRTMPDNLRLPLDGDTKKEMKFKYTESKIFASLSIRSTALHNLHISEICHCNDDEVQATLGAASESTNITCESTGNGIGNLGWETYQNAKAGESEDKMKAMFFPWFIQDEYKISLNGMMNIEHNKEERKLQIVMKNEYDLQLLPEQILWRRDKIKKLKSLFRQEFPETDDDAFLMSGKKYFDIRKAHRLVLETKNWLRTNKFYEQTDDYICFEEPQFGRTSDIYAAGADTSEGMGDPSVFKIINITKQREAFVYRAWVSVPTFYKICDKWCRAYNKARLAVERNNHGHAVILGLNEICQYPNLWEDMKKTRLADKIIVPISKGLPERKYGWTTDSISRPIMLDQLKYAIEGEEEEDEDHFQPEFQIFDVGLLNELLTFEEVDGKFQAIEGKHDDNIFATAICFQVYLELKRYTSKGDNSSGIYTVGKRIAQV